MAGRPVSLVVASWGGSTAYATSHKHSVRSAISRLESETETYRVKMLGPNEEGSAPCEKRLQNPPEPL